MNYHDNDDDNRDGHPRGEPNETRIARMMDDNEEHTNNRQATPTILANSQNSTGGGKEDLEAGGRGGAGATPEINQSNNNDNDETPTSTPPPTPSSSSSCSPESKSHRCVNFSSSCKGGGDSGGGEKHQQHHDKDCDDDTPPASSSSDDEEKGGHSAVSRPALYRRSSSVQSQRALQSFRQSLSRIDSMHAASSGRLLPLVDGGPVSADDDLSKTRKNRWRPWKSWSLPRLRKTSYGVLSSIAVLTIRLYLDPQPMVYLIHSIVVFLDMVLIHFFTNSPWLSVAGEVVTVLCVLGFTLTKETLFELLETTFIAILCSFHLICSRNKHLDSEQHLTDNMKDLRATSLHLLRHLDEVDGQDIADHFGDTDYLNQHDGDTSSIDTVGENTTGLFGYEHDHDACKQKLKLCGEHFFEHFLDGSAGVMYTSFLGLIISELLTYGQEKNY